tara:strand:+ start:376 stop:699 length:324 start_codon:yes stop_codon:yes gene_type:complete
MSEITSRWSDEYSGRWVNRCYLIVPVADIDSADSDDGNPLMDNAIQSSKDTLRKNSGDDGDSSKALLKYSCDNDPDNDPGCYDSYDKYSHSEIMIELAKSEWTSAIE